MRLSSKTIINGSLPGNQSLAADFVLPEIEASIRDKGYDVVLEKAYECPCKGSNSSSFLSTCENCGGSGWIFCNPTKTRMIIHSISSNRKFEQQGQEDLGMVQITAYPFDKLSKMDKITISDVTSEHKEVLYPTLNDAGNANFAYCKYDIKQIDYIALFVSVGQKLVKLEEPSDYTFRDNVVIFASKYNTNQEMQVTIRYSHAPVYHVWDISRDAMFSTIVTNGKIQKFSMPIHALGKRAHLIQDIENYEGDRLLDNSWLPLECKKDELTQFNRQLKYTSSSDIYSNLTAQQKVELKTLLA